MRDSSRSQWCCLNLHPKPKGQPLIMVVVMMMTLVTVWPEESKRKIDNCDNKLRSSKLLTSRRLHPARGILRWMGMIYREREVNMRARNDLRSSRIGSFSRRRGLGHSREAFSGGRRQAGVMKVSRCIAFGTKPALLLCYIVVLHRTIPSCCVTSYNTLLLCYIVFRQTLMHQITRRSLTVSACGEPCRNLMWTNRPTNFMWKIHQMM